MLLTGKLRLGRGSPSVMSRVVATGLYSEVQRIMGNGQMGTPPVDKQTHICENIIFQQLRWRAVITNERNKIKRFDDQVYLKCNKCISIYARPLWIENCQSNIFTIVG